MIYDDIASEFERLFPHHVNTEMRDGVRCAGYDYDETSDIDPRYTTIGRYGNYGEINLPVIGIHSRDLDDALAVLRSIDKITCVDGLAEIRLAFNRKHVRHI